MGGDTAAIAPRRALVVEDDAAISRLVAKLLRRCGFDLDVVADGRAALVCLEASDYSVIVLDLMIPEVDGFKLIDEIRERRIKTPVAVVSAVSQQSLTRLDLDIVKVVISKPFDVDEFTRAIEELCS